METMRRAVFVAAALIPLAQTALAQTYGRNDIPAIVDASRNNELKFNRDYAGRPFAALGAFRNASQPLFFGSYLVNVKIGHATVFCFINDPAVLAQITDWDQGHPVQVQGVIKDTTFGDVKLSDCKMAGQ